MHVPPSNAPQDELVPLIRWSSIVGIKDKGDRSSWTVGMKPNSKYFFKY